jgi:hypothetical protein
MWVKDVLTYPEMVSFPCPRKYHWNIMIHQWLLKYPVVEREGLTPGKWLGNDVLPM